MLTEKQCFLLCTDRKRCYGVVAATAVAAATDGPENANNNVRHVGRGGCCVATRPNLPPMTADQSTDECPDGRHRLSNCRRPPTMTRTTMKFAVAEVPAPTPSSPTVGGGR